MESLPIELEKGLSRITSSLNEERSLYDKYIAGQEFYLETKGEDEFKILITYRNKTTGICADIKLSEGKLEGIIVPMKSAKSVANFLHAFSYQYNLPMGTLGASLEYSL